MSTSPLPDEQAPHWLTFGSGFLLFLVAGFLFLPSLTEPDIAHPVAFNHRKHMDMGLECITCHEFFETQTFSGAPQVATCLTCHEEAITDSPEEGKIRAYAGRGEEIPWVRLFRQPGHVYFSHRRHVAIAEIDCATCHGGIAQSSALPSRRPAQLAMGDCLACHAKQGVSRECTACHK